MSIRKITVFSAILLFVIAAALGVSGKIREKNIKEEYTPSMQTVTVTAVGDCTLATDANADWKGSFNAYANQEGDDYSYFLRNAAPRLPPPPHTIPGRSP